LLEDSLRFFADFKLNANQLSSLVLELDLFPKVKKPPPLFLPLRIILHLSIDTSTYLSLWIVKLSQMQQLLFLLSQLPSTLPLLLITLLFLSLYPPIQCNIITTLTSHQVKPPSTGSRWIRPALTDSTFERNSLKNSIGIPQQQL
jgi:hypothetical protein